jgi:NAD(P) transhydrogenase subunit alpha
VRGALVVRNGEITYPPPKPKVAPPTAAPTAKPAVEVKGHGKAKKKSNPVPQVIFALVVFAGLVFGAPSSFLSHFTVFVLAVFVGWQVIWNVAPALHTPLMSVTNAISGIIIIGGMLQIGGTLPGPVMWLGMIAVLLATINIAGGFLVTQRMLKMFRK